jgi:L-threonylcarbamoyladenylate synthase
MQHQHATSHLERGGVVAAPTETFFGLLADATNPVALDALFHIKPRSGASALIIPTLGAWEPLVEQIPEVARRLAERFWPGPLTIVLVAAPDLDPRLSVEGTVGVRLPGPSVAAEICAAYGRPLTATSANVHGEAPSVDARDATSAFPDAADAGRLLVVPGRSPGGAPSTLVKVTGQRIAVLREGAVPVADIEGAIGAAL